MITVLPEGGLCNRMRVVASAWLFAQACQQPMRVLWHRTPDFNASFVDLFEVRTAPFQVVDHVAMNRLARGTFKAYEVWARLRGDLVLGETATAPGKFNWEDALSQARGRNVFIRTNSKLSHSNGMFDIFVLTGQIADELERLRGELLQCVGVHVRRTDNSKASAESTLDRFVELMQREQLQSRGVRFFLATDDPEVRRELGLVFGDSVWEYQKRAYARNDPKAIVDASIDLYALSQCKKLIGSYWSSFTDTAAEIHNVECVIARSPN